MFIWQQLPPAVPTDFWGVVMPAWLGAVGTIASGVIATIAILGARRNKRGIENLAAGRNEEQGNRVEVGLSASAQVTPSNPRASAGASLSGEGTLSAGGSVRAAVGWIVERQGRSYRLVNRSTTTAAILSEAEEIGDGVGAFSLMQQLPIRIDPLGSIPFNVEKTLTSPAVIAVRLTWREKFADLEPDQPTTTTLYI